MREHRQKYKAGHNFWEGIRYQSQAEIACSKALTKYIDGWQAIEGRTYERPIGHGKTCDFVVNGVLIEFHPVVIPRELYRPSYATLEAELRQMREPQRRAVKGLIRAHLFYEYTRKRLWTIRLSNDPEIRDAELIVVKNADEFYSKVLKRFATKPLPKKRELLKRFKAGNI